GREAVDELVVEVDRHRRAPLVEPWLEETELEAVAAGEAAGLPEEVDPFAAAAEVRFGQLGAADQFLPRAVADAETHLPGPPFLHRPVRHHLTQLGTRL